VSASSPVRTCIRSSAAVVPPAGFTAAAEVVGAGVGLAPPEAAGAGAPHADTMGLAAMPRAVIPRPLSIARRLNPPLGFVRDIIHPPSRRPPPLPVRARCGRDTADSIEFRETAQPRLRPGRRRIDGRWQPAFGRRRRVPRLLEQLDGRQGNAMLLRVQNAAPVVPRVVAAESGYGQQRGGRIG